MGANRKIQAMNDILNYKIEQLPLKYLGLPVDDVSRSSSIWGFVIEKFQKKLAQKVLK